MSSEAHKLSFSPRECLSGKIGRINRLTANIFRKYIAPFGVTDSQLTLLFILSSGMELTQKELSDIAKLEKSSVNRNLKRLIESDYITRKYFPKLKITSTGKKLVTNILPEWEKAMAEITNLLGSEGVSAVNTIHSKLTKNIS
ncbi:MarR family winged helix-turn-helix transcriptional regulator [Ulvibacter antarcticus]|uniref:DNA-binding MarR family transcriptional regulator n=1 Tax=Ulvibacter antarcticus TaxID=442714 RepID=A0A3L9YCD0_9FLAO|nr:MarR family winged helix-turn-helix transcriptional regulator [Ulvibacter antarcticus]RMA58024.1 DNA-binding MarR family transcriptional regulator [Ulvibacter antarcticus]